MDNILQTAIMIATVVSIGVLALKAILRKDLGIASAIIPRLYLVGILIYDLIIRQVTPTYFHIGVLIIFIGDIVSNLFIIMSNRFKIETYSVHLLDLLSSLKEKYEFIIEHAPIGIFVINQNGRPEFVNNELAKLLGCSREELLKKSAFDFVKLDSLGWAKEKLYWDFLKQTQVDFITEIQDCRGEIHRVRITAKRTSNGHPTFTGCVIPL